MIAEQHIKIPVESINRKPFDEVTSKKTDTARERKKSGEVRVNLC